MIKKYIESIFNVKNAKDRDQYNNNKEKTTDEEKTADEEKTTDWVLSIALLVSSMYYLSIKKYNLSIPIAIISLYEIYPKNKTFYTTKFGILAALTTLSFLIYVLYELLK